MLTPNTARGIGLGIAKRQPIYPFLKGARNLNQQMRGNCSPLNQSTSRLPPNRVSIVTN